jgi:hypothetical protein
MKQSIVFGVLCFALGVGSPVAAQDDEAAIDDEAAAAADESGDAASGEGDGEAAPDGATAAEPEAAAAGSHAWSFGPYVRFVIVPSFMLNLFLDLSPTVANAAFGATATYHTDGGPSFDMGIGYTSYAFSGPFRKKGGDPGETEWVQSDLGLVHLTGSILWEAKISEPLAFQYGLGLDVGIVTGSLRRTEAYQKVGGGWAKCAGPNAPRGIYCLPPLTTLGPTDPANKDGEQYNVKDTGIPPVFGLPMLPQLALRYTPIPELVLRVQAAYGIAQFWFGLSAAYAPAL